MQAQLNDHFDIEETINNGAVFDEILRKYGDLLVKDSEQTRKRRP